MHQLLTVHLKVDIQTEFDVTTRNRGNIMGAVIVFSLDSSVSVADKYLNAFFPTQIFFLAFFHAEVAAIVSGGIIIITFDVTLRYLPDVAKHICRS